MSQLLSERVSVQLTHRCLPFLFYQETHCDWFVFQTRDPDLESGDDLEETDREYCQVLLPSILVVVNYLHTLQSTYIECDNVACIFHQQKRPSWKDRAIVVIVHIAVIAFVKSERCCVL